MDKARLEALKSMVQEDYMTVDPYSEQDVISRDGEDLLALIDAELARQVPDGEIQATIETIQYDKWITEEIMESYCSWGNQQKGVDECKKSITHYDLAIAALRQYHKPDKEGLK